MDTQLERENVGLFDDRYRAFLETIAQVRPRLHYRLVNGHCTGDWRPIR